MEFIRAKGSYAVVFGKSFKVQQREILGIQPPVVYATSKEISHEGQGLTAVEKIFNRNAVGVSSGTVLHAGSDVRVKVNIVGSQDTTGLMTSQELENDGSDRIFSDLGWVIPIGLSHGFSLGL